MILDATVKNDITAGIYTDIIITEKITLITCFKIIYLWQNIVNRVRIRQVKIIYHFLQLTKSND